MRQVFAVLLVTALVQTSIAQVSTQGRAVPPGTEVEIELLQSISSETLKDGQTIPFKLVRPLELKGESLLPAGTAVTGVVKGAHTSGKWRKNGLFDLTLQPLKLPDGALVPIDFPRPRTSSEKVEKAGETTAEAMALTYYFPLIPAVLIAGSRKGKPFNIRSGERYLVYVTSPPGAAAPPATDSPKP